MLQGATQQRHRFLFVTPPLDHPDHIHLLQPAFVFRVSRRKTISKLEDFEVVEHINSSHFSRSEWHRVAQLA